MVCIAEHIFQDGEWGILEWRDPSDPPPLNVIHKEMRGEKT
jgi:hypothetical protein